MFKIHTLEPGPVLGNLDLNRTLVGDPYLGTWTRTRLCTHPYSFWYSWPNIGDSYGKCEFKRFMTPLFILYASIDSNPHPLESLDRDDSELETRYGLKSENCVENTNYALKV